MPTTTPRLERALIALSALGLIVGLAFPVAAKLVDPIYGLPAILIGVPACGIGTFAAALAGSRQVARGQTGRLAWGLLVANVFVAAVTLATPFPVMS